MGYGFTEVPELSYGLAVRVAVLVIPYGVEKVVACDPGTVLSVNLKRTLACSSMSQIGFIMVGTGMYSILGETGILAARGTVLHMVNHSLIKLVLFESAGVVVMRLHALTLSQIRGFGRNKLPLKLAFLSGALGISGVPLFCGYLSKTLLHEGITEGIHLLGASYTVFLKCCEILFLVGGGLTFA